MRQYAVPFTRLGLALSIVALGIAPPARGAAAAKDSGAGVARNRAAALLDNGEDAKAIEAFRDLAKRYPDSASDRVNLAIALINHNDLDGAESELRTALAESPDDLRAHYNLGLVLKKRGKNDDAAKEMALVAASSAGAKDATVWYQLGLLNKRLRKSDDALAAFRKAVALQPEHGSAHFQIYNELVQRGDKAAAQPELDEFKILQKATPEFQRNEAYLERGTFTKIDAPGESGLAPASSSPASTAPASIRFEARGKSAGASGNAEGGGSGRLQWLKPSAVLADFDGDGALDIAVGVTGRPVRIYRNDAGIFSKTMATLDVPAAVASNAGPGGPGKKGEKEDRPEDVPDPVGLASGDIDNDGDADLLVTSGTGVRLFLNDGKGRFTDATKSAGLGGTAGSAGAVFADLDRDGDLDLVLGSLGVRRALGGPPHAHDVPSRSWVRPRLFLNAGLYGEASASSGSAPVAPPRFMPMEPEGLLPEQGEAVAAADLRGRGDSDLVFGAANLMWGIAHNRRGGRIAFDTKEGIGGDGRVEPAVESQADAPSPPFPPDILTEDLDGDGHVDLLAGWNYWNNGSGFFPDSPQPPWGTNGLPAGSRHLFGETLLDADGDGWIDIATATEPERTGSDSTKGKGSEPSSRSAGIQVRLFRNQGSRRFQEAAGAAETLSGWRGPVAIVSGDLDGDGDPDLAVVTADAPPVVLANVTKTPNRWIKVGLKGGKTNRSGLGAKIEVRADRLFATRESDGNPTLVGIGPRGRADAVRIVWTSGVTQDLIDVPAGPVKIEEKREFSGSCPFLYAWDGTVFRFVGEALSGAPVGFLRPDGAYESPRPTEHLRLPPGSLVARGGRLSLRMTEEMRELSALDSVRLVAVDHPENVEVYSNERLTEKIGPFRYVAVADLRPADGAQEDLLGSSGAGGRRADADAGAAATLAALDDRAASGFATLGPRLEGLAEPHVLDLTFRHPPAAPSRLALVLDGWVAWTTSDVSRALLQATGSNAHAEAGEGGGAANAGGVANAPGSFAGIAPPPSPNPWGPALEVRAPGAPPVSVSDIGLPIGPSMLAPLPDAGATAGVPLDVRIGTSLAVYYDRIRLGRIVDVPLTVRELAPIEAHLRWRGVAAERRARDDEATRPDYDAISPLSPFPRLDEETTPLGDVLETVSKADGRMAVFGTGDEVAIEFDAAAIPAPAPGTARTWFLVSTGYARDGDPNTKPMSWKP